MRSAGRALAGTMGYDSTLGAGALVGMLTGATMAKIKDSLRPVYEL